MELVDIVTCIADPLMLEEGVFKIWLNGYTGKLPPSFRFLLLLDRIFLRRSKRFPFSGMDAVSVYY